MTSQSPSIAENLATIQYQIAHAKQAFLLEGTCDTTLIAVSKTHPQATIKEALNAGQRVFGENRVQEAQEKWPELKAAFPDVQLHLIGPLQSNKIDDALDIFDVIHTVDREKLASKLSNTQQQRNINLPCFIQINTGEEPQKAGITPQEADDFITYCRNEQQLNIIGLMCIPPVDDRPAPHFALLKKIAEKHTLNELSMGMSSDFETACAMGASYVRVGSAIFGKRQ